ncbi:MAG: DeoR/GlpR family DNA-binding transcription regulator [Planctomycetota bacterium]|jgi:DeoR/GlpR family transcriptional regulator of sugar metabolism|nr:DeoR/GlpR family DNA-binding transcription regulator [Planctomycetota bacterium]
MANDREPISTRSGLILEMLQSRRSVKVSELCAILQVSEITIRRDLNDMAAKGLIRRVHGGAVLADSGEDARFFANRAQQNAEVKRLLAAEAAKLVPDNGSVYLDSGSTCFEVARHLATTGREYLIVTDSILVLRELFGIPRLETMILGGSLARDQVTVDGHLSTENARKLALDVCLFSANGFTTEHLANHYLSGVSTKETMIRTVKTSICVVDASKFGQLGRFQFCRWDDVDVMITDSRLPEQAREEIADKGVRLHIVPAK